MLLIPPVYKTDPGSKKIKNLCQVVAENRGKNTTGYGDIT
jgi:hypothetical protein